MSVNDTKNRPQDETGGKGNDKEKDKLHIFINKIKFDEEKGVKPKMTGGELADLVSVPRDNAKISRQRDNQEFTVEQTIDIHMADHFEIIRKRVQAGAYGKQ
jgi:hypothetical protein